jgi:hypothetical protein
MDAKIELDNLEERLSFSVTHVLFLIKSEIVK